MQEHNLCFLEKFNESLHTSASEYGIATGDNLRNHPSSQTTYNGLLIRTVS